MTFFRSTDTIALDLASLVLRVISGGALITHGYPKLAGFTQKMNSFADPIGIGSPGSLSLIFFAEVLCSVFLILGLFTRAVLIPLIGAMITLVFIVHWHHGFPKKELPLLYLAIFITLFFMGPGKYSIDGRR